MQGAQELRLNETDVKFDSKRLDFQRVRVKSASLCVSELRSLWNRPAFYKKLQRKPYKSNNINSNKSDYCKKGSRQVYENETPNIEG